MTVSLNYHGNDLGTYDSMADAFLAAAKLMAPHCLLYVEAETASKVEGGLDGWGVTHLAERVEVETERVTVQADGKLVFQQRCVVTPTRRLSRGDVVGALEEVYGPVGEA